MKKYLIIIATILFSITSYAQQILHGNATEKYTGSYEHRIVNNANDTTFRVDVATGNITNNKGITKSRRFWSTDTVGNGNGEPAFNVERTLNGVNSPFGVGYNERTTLVGGQSSNYTAYLAQSNIGASATGKYGLYITYYSNPGINVLDTLLEHRGVLVSGAINNAGGRVRDWYGFYYQQPSGGGQIYGKHVGLFISLQTKGTNIWAIQSVSSAPSNLLGRLGIAAVSADTVPKAILHIGAGGTAANSAPIKVEIGPKMTTPESGAIEYDGSRWYATNGTATRRLLDNIQVDSLVNITTTNATPSTVLSIPIPNDGDYSTITVDMTGKSTNDYIRGIKTATIANKSGTLAIIGTTPQDIVTTISDAALATATFTITTSGTNAIIQVTGIAATTINWRAIITYKIN